MKKILILPLLLTFFNISAQIQVFSDFENGNVELLSANTTFNYIVFRPSLEDSTNTTRCWFYFGITDFDTSQVLTLQNFYSIEVAAPNNPVYSYDQKHWFRLSTDTIVNHKKIYKNKFTADTVFFAAGYPYTYSHILQLVDSLSENPLIDTFTLTYSENGHRVPMFTIADKNFSQKNMIWIIGRQHAFETTLNYALEGMIDFFLSDDKVAEKLRRNTIIYIVPMMDVDNVIKGASGRMQQPIDFNRDWTQNPHWNAVCAVKDSIKKSAKKYSYKIFLDVHSTYPGANKPIFGLFNSYDKNRKEFKNLRHFFKTFKKIAGYELVEIRGNMNKNYADVYSAGQITDSVKTSVFSTTVECDWNDNFNGNSLTISELRRVGYLIAKAVAIEALK